MNKSFKTDYNGSVNKRAVQADILSLIKGRYKHIIGLAGPNINSYLKMVHKAGIKDATIYENSALQLLIQMQRFNPIIPTTVRFEDVLEAPVAKNKNTLYDLDFCCSVDKAKEHIQKFSNNSTIITLAMRPHDKKYIMGQYMKYTTGSDRFLVEVDKVDTHFIKYNLQSLKTNKRLLCHTYHDTTSMLVFTNNI